MKRAYSFSDELDDRCNNYLAYANVLSHKVLGHVP